MNARPTRAAGRVAGLGSFAPSQMRLLIRSALLGICILQFAGCKRPIERAVVDLFEEARAAEEELAQTFDADVRIPSASNLSGVWTSGLGLGGYKLGLEQRGDAVEGSGFDWGCSGLSALLTVSGSYRNGVLSLRFVRDGLPAEPRDYTLTQTPKGLSLHGTVYGEADVLYTANDVRRLLEALDRRATEASVDLPK